MKTIKSIMLTAALLTSLIMASMVGAESGIVIDDEDDVIKATELDDQFSGDTTDQRPNVDIVQVSYDRTDGTKDVTATLKVNSRGIIEDRYDLESFDVNQTDLNGSVITYTMYIKTTENDYQISYFDGNCTLGAYGDQQLDYDISGNTLDVYLTLNNVSETIVNISGAAAELSLNFSAYEFTWYSDFAPDESLFYVTASADKTDAETGQNINFDVELEDPFTFTTGPYTYTWDFDDGSTSSSESPTHSYSLAGEYQVEVTVEDGNGETATNEITVTVSKGSTNNNGGGNNGEDNGDGSGLLLFVGIIAIIVVIGIIALVFVIRR